MHIEIPLKKFVVVCGLSGSGKTTLIELINKSIKAYLVEKKQRIQNTILLVCQNILMS